MRPSIVLLENESQLHLFPLTLTRSAADLRIGMLTIREKWAWMTGGPVPVLPAGSAIPADAEVYPANLLPLQPLPVQPAERMAWAENQPRVERSWQASTWNARAIESDISLVTQGRPSAPLPPQVRSSAPERIFLEPGAILEHVILNASEGPIYIGKGAHVMDGAVLRGPVAILEGAVVKMGAMLYGGTTIGPYCVAGGEIKNSILHGYTNKAHEGYLGDAYIGEWCNLGAGTSCSNLKNSARPVRVWNEYLHQFESAALKCGLIMGDFSRSAINTSFNTGTVTGICCNIFSPGMLTPGFIPSFSWGRDNIRRYEIDRALEDIRTWMQFKQREPDQALEMLIRQIYQTH